MQFVAKFAGMVCGARFATAAEEGSDCSYQKLRIYFDPKAHIYSPPPPQITQPISTPPVQS